MKVIIFVISVFLTLPSLAQIKYGSPVNFPITLAGNVGEIRADHFHSGIDIKATQGVGSPVLATADGYISRIGVSPSGYGNVLYVTHPNGDVSVYGHLDGFVPKVSDWVRRQQYAKQSFKVDLYPSRDRFIVKAGERIAMLGNSGSSGGPHLHFEIRDGKSGNCINLISAGLFKVADKQPPLLKKIHVFELDTVNGIYIHSLKQTIDIISLNQIPPIKINKNSYLAYEVVDYRDNRTNTMGVYSIEQKINGKQNFSFSIDNVSFSTSRYINSFTAYWLAKKSKFDVIRAYVSSNNALSFYRGIINRGVISPSDSPINVETRIEDDQHNAITFRLSIEKSTPSLASVIEPAGEAVRWNQDFRYTQPNFEVAIPQKSLYESDYIIMESDGDTIFTVGSEKIPLQKAMSLKIKCLNPTSKTLIAQISTEGKVLRTLNTSIDNQWLKTTTNRLGQFKIVLDNTPPKIQYLATQGGALKFKITDDLSGVEYYNLKIDGQWELAEFDAKTATLTHRQIKGQTPINHDVELVVRDAVGNETKFKRQVKW